MLRQILVPLDGSPAAEEAVPFAEHLAATSHAAVILLLVHDTIRTFATEAPDGGALAEEVSRQDDHNYHRRVMQPLAAELSARLGVQVAAELVEGSAVASISEVIRRESIDLVVLTTHGRTGLRRALIGSVADDLLSAAGVPILMIRSTADGHGRLARSACFRRILVPLDGSVAEERQLQLIESLGRATGASIVLTRIVEPVRDVHDGSSDLPATMHNATQSLVDAANEYLDGVAGEMRACTGAEVRTIVEINASVPHAVAAIARRVDPDLVVVRNRTHGLRKLLVGGLADTILKESRSALLVLQDRSTAPPVEGRPVAAESGVKS